MLDPLTGSSQPQISLRGLIFLVSRLPFCTRTTEATFPHRLRSAQDTVCAGRHAATLELQHAVLRLKSDGMPRGKALCGNGTAVPAVRGKLSAGAARCCGGSTRRPWQSLAAAQRHTHSLVTYGSASQRQEAVAARDTDSCRSVRWQCGCGPSAIQR